MQSSSVYFSIKCKQVASERETKLHQGDSKECTTTCQSISKSVSKFLTLNFKIIAVSEPCINPPMAKGDGGGVDATPSRFFQFFSEMGRAFLQTKFLPVGSFLGHLPMKKFFKSDLPSWL